MSGDGRPTTQYSTGEALVDDACAKSVLDPPRVLSFNLPVRDMKTCPEAQLEAILGAAS